MNTLPPAVPLGWYEKPEWWLVIVGFGTLFLIWWQAKKTAEATQAMRDSLPLQKSAADAALLNAQAVINSDRPWVVIHVSQQSGLYCFRASNLGKTPAEIISFAAEFRCVSRVEDLPNEPEYGTEYVPIIRLLVPGENVGDADVPLLSYQRFAELSIRCARTVNPVEHALMSGPKLSVFYFRVLYKNPISMQRPDIANHETRMCFCYSPSADELLEVCGREEYNRHT